MTKIAFEHTVGDCEDRTPQLPICLKSNSVDRRSKKGAFTPELVCARFETTVLFSDVIVARLDQAVFRGAFRQASNGVTNAHFHTSVRKYMDIKSSWEIKNFLPNVMLPLDGI